MPTTNISPELDKAITNFGNYFAPVFREEAARIVREEWHDAVKEFKLKPGSPTEMLVGRILDRLTTA